MCSEKHTIFYLLFNIKDLVKIIHQQIWEIKIKFRSSENVHIVSLL